MKVLERHFLIGAERVQDFRVKVQTYYMAEIENWKKYSHARRVGKNVSEIFI